MDGRLSPLDASFLRLETRNAHMHVGWCSVLELPPGRESLDADLLRRRILARIHHAPRFRQRVASMPLGEPAWVDHTEFDIREHIEIADDSELLLFAERTNETPGVSRETSSIVRVP